MWYYFYFALFLHLSRMILDCITAQDMAFGAYDEDRYVKFMMQDIHEAFPGLGTGMPARWVQQWYSACYYWPNVTPLPPIGNPTLKGIVAGQLFDHATPYIWTQVPFACISCGGVCTVAFVCFVGVSLVDKPNSISNERRGIQCEIVFLRCFLAMTCENSFLTISCVTAFTRQNSNAANVSLLF